MNLQSNPTSVASSPSADFEDLGLSKSLLEAVRKSGYTVPTPIQSLAIPHALDGTDILGCAQTGTGKTAAFALPILNEIILGQDSRPTSNRTVNLHALVLAPTRELAAQIAQSFQGYGRSSGIHTQVVYGGVSKVPQIRNLRRGCHVLVATPGRLLDLMNDRAVSLGGIKTLVLDEADRMLDMGFIHDVRRIARAIPKVRQTLLFSATMPQEVVRLTKELLTNPVRIEVPRVMTEEHPISQSVYFVEGQRKHALLVNLLDGDNVERALVFTRTKHGANRLAQKLARCEISAAAIHGNKSQAARERALRDFKSGRTQVIVATDVAARGIDVKGLSHVFNFDMPHDAESYVHRVGRTGRAGETGIAISFCGKKEKALLKDIEVLTKNPLERPTIPAGIPRISERETDPNGANHLEPDEDRSDRRGRQSSRTQDSRGPRRPSAGGSRGGNTRSGDSRSGDSRSGDSRSGDSRSGDSRSSGGRPSRGNTRSPDARRSSSDARSGDSRTGGNRSGDSRTGGAPRSSDNRTGGAARSSDSRSGGSRSGDSRTGDSRSSGSRSGDYRSGDSRTGGQGRSSSQSRSGDQSRSSESRSSGEKRGFGSSDPPKRFSDGFRNNDKPRSKKPGAKPPAKFRRRKQSDSN